MTLAQISKEGRVLIADLGADGLHGDGVVLE